MLKRIISNIPNTITCLSLVCGALAIIASFEENFQWACALIGIAALCDFLDGALARLLHAYSNLGKQLDSLSDLVSFGVAPGLLMFNVMSIYTGGCLPLIALLIPVFGEIRLAKFNIDDRQTTYFLGMPIPANAIFWIGACSFISTYGYPGDAVMVAAIVIISLLMVLTRFKMFSLKFKNFRLKENMRRYAVLLGAVLFVAFFGVAGFSLSIIFYILLSLLPEQREA
ncbi:MAG: CDP-diacylglycerol--serine O-phosphatidyltransferase [Bacteroides sp.]|nr:CDP-diacylglycerol--serine O-phosphatidyltransferase [Bacteroides sp.]MBD5285087.1 CDP-diacylglycerol--serine O-phosphatidyltransferase [Bacteroides sp.]